MEGMKLREGRTVIRRTVIPGTEQDVDDLIEIHGLSARNYAARRLEAAHRFGMPDSIDYWLQIYRAVSVGRKRMPRPYPPIRHQHEPSAASRAGAAEAIS